jgi:multiple sugar transport system permease protein
MSVVTYRHGFEDRAVKPRKAWFGPFVDRHLVVLFNVPTFAVLGALVGVPVLAVLYTSMTDWYLYTPQNRKFVGLANYLQIFTDERWLRAIWQTFYFAGGSVFLQFLLGFAFALLLNQKFKGIRFYTSVFMLPMLAMSTAVSLVWMILYNSSFGFFNYALTAFGLSPVEWLGDPRWAMPSLILVQIWQWTPFMALLLLSGLQSLPPEPYEAARIDGATWWQSFIHITLPFMRGHIVVALVLRSLVEVKEFDTIMTMTEGGPNGATETMNMNIYLSAFSYGQVGMAAAKGVFFFLIILLVQMLIVRKRERSWSH